MAVLHMNFLCKSKGHQENVTIILPTDGMNERHEGVSFVKTGIRYQTLWLLHGGGGDDGDFIKFSNIVRYAEEARLAVVMPAGTSFYDTDYSYITEELPSMLRAILPLSDRKEDNFICGLSHGGDAALKACLDRPECYAAGLIMSAAGTDHHGPVKDAALRFDVFGMARKDIDSGAKMPVLVFATGSGDRGFPYYTPIIDRLDAMGLPVERHFEDGEGHSWEFWDRMVNKLCKGFDGLIPVKRDVIVAQ